MLGGGVAGMWCASKLMAVSLALACHATFQLSVVFGHHLYLRAEY